MIYDKNKPVFSENSTLGAILEYQRFGCLKTPLTCKGKAKPRKSLFSYPVGLQQHNFLW